MNYNAPGRTYSLKNKPQIISWMKETHLELTNRMTGRLVEILEQ